MSETSNVIATGFKLIAPAIGNIIGGPVAGALGAFVGAAVEETTEGFIERIGQILAGVGPELIDDQLRHAFADAIEIGLSAAVIEVKQRNRQDIEKLDKNARRWLERKLDEFRKIHTWEQLNAFVPENFGTFREFYFEPIRRFLSEGKPESIPEDLIAKIAEDLANGSLDSVIESVRSGKGMAIFNTIFTIYAELYTRAGLDERKLKLRIKPMFKTERKRLTEWTLQQIELMRSQMDSRLDEIEFRIDLLEIIVQNHERRLIELERKMARQQEFSAVPPKPRLGGWHGLPAIDLKTAVDRPEILNHLEDILNGQKQIAVVGLHGMGGVGKSFIVRLFIERNRQKLEKRFPDGVLWVGVAESATAESAATTALAYIYESLEGIQDKLVAFKGLLTGHRMLVVFDGAENFESGEVEKLIFDPQNSRIIFTTRRDFDIPKIDVDVMTPDEAVELFRKIIGGDVVNSQLEDFQRLADVLGRLPLAIEIVAKRMKKHGWSPLETLERFNELRTKFIKMGRGRTKETSLEVSFELSFRELNDFERDVLFGLGVFSLKGARESLLAEVMGIDPKDTGAMDELARALESLADLSLVKPPSVENGERFWSMHPLLRDFVNIRAKEAGKLDDLRRRFVEVMLERAREWHGETKKTAEEGYSTEKHRSAIEFALMERENLFEALATARSLDMPGTLSLAIYAGSLFESAGLFDDELAVFLTAEKIADELFKVYSKLQKQVGEPIEKLSKPLLSSIAATYNNIGGAYTHKGEYDRAIEFYNKALEIVRKVLGEEHPDTTTTYNNIGGAYTHKGEYDKAIEFYNKALEIRLNVLGESHPDTATTYNNLGVAYDSKGEYDRAIEFYNKALEIDKKVLGENHPGVATDYNNLGGAYDSKGEYDRAIEFYNKALEIFEKILGQCHPYTRTVLGNLMMAYMKKGDFENLLNAMAQLAELEQRCGK